MCSGLVKATGGVCVCRYSVFVQATGEMLVINVSSTWWIYMVWLQCAYSQHNWCIQRALDLLLYSCHAPVHHRLGSFWMLLLNLHSHKQMTCSVLSRKGREVHLAFYFLLFFFSSLLVVVSFCCCCILLGYSNSPWCCSMLLLSVILLCFENFEEAWRYYFFQFKKL